MERPKIKPFTFPRVLLEGETVNTGCVTSGQGQYSFKWLKNGHELVQEKGRVAVFEMGSASTLIINKVSALDASNYTCIASSSTGSDAYSAQLVISSRPKWLIEPISVKLTDGRSSIVDCVAIGSPPVTTNWYFGDVKGNILEYYNIWANRMFLLLILCFQLIRIQR